MILLYYYLALVFIAIGVVALGVYFKRRSEKSYTWFLKILSLVVASVFIVRYMWDYEAVSNMFMLVLSPYSTKFESVVGLFVVWFSMSVNLLMQLYGFFKSKLTNKMVGYLGAPVIVLTTICLRLNLIGVCGAGALDKFSLWPFLIVIETGLVLGYVVFVMVNEYKDIFKKRIKRAKEKVVFENKKEKFKYYLTCVGKFFKKYWFPTFCVIVFFLSTIPDYTLKALFGNVKQSASALSFNLPHRIILYVGIIIPIVIHNTLKNKDYLTKKFLILFICLGTLIIFSNASHKASSFVHINDWPLHLCNTAMYIMPLVLILKWDKFFYFTYFINVAGAFLAMLMPSYSASANLFSTRMLGFYTNHYIACFMPILFVSLGLFKKPKLKEFIYSMIGFAVYFFGVTIINAVFTGMFEAGLTTHTTDFFYVNSDFIAEKLGKWAEDLRIVTVQVPVGGITLTFYWLYQVLFFATYIGIGLAVWFIYAYVYQIKDFYVNLSKKREKIKLDELALCAKYDKKEINDCMNQESVDKLVVKNATKCYGNSQVYSLKDANIEVHAGEILGFLGPNGAGKSTLIKSVVGMQPLTSGSIEINGYDIEKQPVLAKSQLGFVPDHYALYEKLTGREYVNYIADLYGVEKEERDKRLQDLIDKLNMDVSIDNQIRTYSHGMKQKIAIMSALIHNPKLWILDEPLTGLDPNSIHQVKECMKEHAEKGNIVFFSSHIIDIVEKLCNRIIIIKKGKIRAEITLEELKQKGIDLEQYYLDTINSVDDVAEPVMVEKTTTTEEKKTKKKEKLVKQK